MNRSIRYLAGAAAALALFGLVAAVALVDDDADDTTTAGVTTTVVSDATTTSTTPPPTVPPNPLLSILANLEPRPDDGVPRVLVHPAGVALPIVGGQPGAWQVTTPCGRDAVVTKGRPRSAAHVVIDAGHGGFEPGAVGPTGLLEKDINLDVARSTAEVLRGAGVKVILTRTADVRMPLTARTAVAKAIDPLLFVSVHHNAEPDGPFKGPGTETYYQIDDPESRRASALIYRSVRRALREFDADWVGDTDAGAKYRLGSTGADYYGVLRTAVPVPAVLAELAFVSNPSEEALLRQPEVIEALGAGLARGIADHLAGVRPPDVFTEPYPRTTPAGPGGGASSCEDPPLA